MYVLTNFSLSKDTSYEHCQRCVWKSSSFHRLLSWKVGFIHFCASVSIP